MRIAYHEPDMREMIATLRRSAKEIREQINQMRAIGKALKDGILLGQGGDAWGQSINGPLSSSMERLAQRLEERASFIERELEQHIEAERRSKGQFK